MSITINNKYHDSKVSFDVRLISQYSVLIHNMMNSEIDLSKYERDEPFAAISADGDFEIFIEIWPATEVTWKYVRALFNEPYEFNVILNEVINDYEEICGCQTHVVANIARVLAYLDCPFLLYLLMSRYISNIFDHFYLANGEYHCNFYKRFVNPALDKIHNCSMRMKIFLCALNGVAFSLYIENDGTITTSPRNIEEYGQVKDKSRIIDLVVKDGNGFKQNGKTYTYDEVSHLLSPDYENHDAFYQGHAMTDDALCLHKNYPYDYESNKNIIVDKDHYELAHLFWVFNLQFETVTIYTYKDIGKPPLECKYNARKNTPYEKMPELKKKKCENIPDEIKKRCKKLIIEECE